jgi:hypothetical protein
VNTFSDQSIELVKLNIWLLIMLSLAIIIFYFPTKHTVLLGGLIGPVNMVFKINSSAPSHKFKALFHAILGIVCVSLIICIWLPTDLLAINDLYCIRLFSLCLLAMVTFQYIDKFGEIKT